MNFRLKFQNLKTNKKNKQINKNKNMGICQSYTKLLAKSFIKPIENKTFSTYHPLVIKLLNNTLRVEFSRFRERKIDGVYMRPEVKSNRNEISFNLEKN